METKVVQIDKTAPTFTSLRCYPNGDTKFILSFALLRDGNGSGYSKVVYYFDGDQSTSQMVDCVTTSQGYGAYVEGVLSEHETVFGYVIDRAGNASEVKVWTKVQYWIYDKYSGKPYYDIAWSYVSSRGGVQI